MKKKAQKSITSGLFSRGTQFVSLAAGMGKRAATYKVKQILDKSLDSKQAQLLRNTLLSQAEALALQLGHMKGSVMKAGQLLSMYGESFLPPEVNKILKSLQFESSPIEWSQIEKTLKEQLGVEKLAELDVEKEPLASASIGQVHKAKIKATGQEVAIKIQYPDVDKAIENDMKLLGYTFSLAELYPQVPHLDMLLDEVKKMLYQEIDYEKELAFTIKYYELLKADDRYLVPRAFPQYSTKKILTTEYLIGHQVDSKEVQQISLERKNHIAASMLDLYMRELFEFKMVQTDPHLGNYRIRLRVGQMDQLVLFDFGAIRKLEDSFVVPYKKMLRAAYHNDEDMLLEAACEIGFIIPGDGAEIKDSFIDFCRTILEPFSYRFSQEQKWYDEEGRYNWKDTDLPKRLTEKVTHVIKSFKLRVPPQEVVFIDRKTSGVFIFLKVIEAQWDGEFLIKKYMD